MLPLVLTHVIALGTVLSIDRGWLDWPERER